MAELDFTKIWDYWATTQEDTREARLALENGAAKGSAEWGELLTLVATNSPQVIGVVTKLLRDAPTEAARLWLAVGPLEDWLATYPDRDQVRAFVRDAADDPDLVFALRACVLPDDISFDFDA